MRLQWTDNAHEDIFRIADFLDAGIAGTGNRMLGSVLIAANLLVEHPQIGPVIAGSHIRKWPVADWPYLLLYQVSSEMIAVLRVVHSRSDWQSLA